MQYAVIENGVVINTVIADEDYAKDNGLIVLPEDISIGDTWDGATFTKSNDVIAKAVRQERNKRLSATDWRFRTDMNPSQEWKDYCQALRDLPDQPGFPWNIVWPKEP